MTISEDTQTKKGMRSVKSMRKERKVDSEDEEITTNVYYGLNDKGGIVIDEDSIREEFDEQLNKILKKYPEQF